MILEHGNDHLRSTVVPRLLSGEALGCFGYSEPDSGSDVAAAQTRAERYLVKAEFATAMRLAGACRLAIR